MPIISPDVMEEEIMRRKLLLAAVALVLTAGCAARKTEATKHLTERQRDSILAQTPLPGAGVVGRALDASDRQAARAATMDAQTDSLPR